MCNKLLAMFRSINFLLINLETKICLKHLAWLLNLQLLQHAPIIGNLTILKHTLKPITITSTNLKL